MQIIGGESYMTENEVEMVYRDSRINLILEGANEVMQSFVWAYGGKRLLESMLGVKGAVGWNKDESFAGNLARIGRNLFNPTVFKAAVPLGFELFLGVRRARPRIGTVGEALHAEAARLCGMVREFSHQYKQACKRYEESLITRQAVQARLADCAIMLHAWACTLSKLDHDLRLANGHAGQDHELERDRTAALHFFDLAENAIHHNFRELYENTDGTMLAAAGAAIRHNDTLPNSDFAIPERSPVAAGTGRTLRQEGIKQFPGDKHGAAKAITR
jgi:hypothetical protein